MRVVLTSRLMMSQAVSVLSLLQYSNNSNLPPKGGLHGLFVKVLGDEGSFHTPADNVHGGECPHTTYYSNNSDLVPHKGGLRGLFVKILGNEGSPHFPADDVPGR